MAAYRIVKKYSIGTGAQFARVENTQTGRIMDIKVRGMREPSNKHTRKLGEPLEYDKNAWGDSYPTYESRAKVIAEMAKSRGL